MMDERTIRVIVLVTLVIQNAGQSIVITQSRIPNSEGKTYNASVAVFIQELLKLVISSALLLYILYRRDASQAGKYDSLPITVDDDIELQTLKKKSSVDVGDLLISMKKEVLTSDALKMILPASLYVAQNHLQLIAASNVDATNFAVLSQMKIITTAIFTVTFLGRILTRKQWCSVFGLFLGVVLVQLSPDIVSKSSIKISGTGLLATATYHSTKGMLALLGSCILSGFAGVYTEKVLTRSASSIWANTLQMSICSMLPAAIPIILGGIKAFLEPQSSGDGLFACFGGRAWLAVIYNVWGGFTVALTMKVSSSMAKSFATSIAIVVTFIVSILVLHDTIAPLRFMGAVVVVSSAYSYSITGSTSSVSTKEQEREETSLQVDSHHADEEMIEVATIE